MPSYFGTLFLSNFPFCREEVHMVNGVEKACLVIPCDEAQMDRTKEGKWFVRLQINQVKPNPQLRTHTITLGYRSMKDLDRAKALRYFNKDVLGYTFIKLMPDGENTKRDYTNNMTPITCDGRLFLDSIQREDIKSDPTTGRKYIDFTFRKTPKLDAFGNSHEIIVRTTYGEHNIAVAKELRQEDNNAEPQAAVAPAPEQTTNNKQHPTDYDGHKW